MKKLYMTTFKILHILALFLFAIEANADTYKMWVGETITYTTPSIDAPTGYHVIVTGYSWSIPDRVKKNCTVNAVANKCTVTLNSWFSGSTQITCTRTYYLVSSNGKWGASPKTSKAYCHIDCNEVEVSFDDSNINLSIGESQILSYTFTPPSSNPSAYITSFESSNSKIASVSGAGKVTGVSQGTATITATTNFGTSAQCVVKVNPIVATSLELSESSKSMNIGQTEKLTATIFPSNTTNKTITWTSSDKNVADVDNEGGVTANGLGYALITASTSNGKKAYCNITVKPIEALYISLNTTICLMNIGQDTTLVASIIPANTTDKTITWVSNNNNIASVQDGVVLAKDEGTVVVTAYTSNGLSAQCTVIVVNDGTSIESPILVSKDDRILILSAQGVLIKEGTRDDLDCLPRGIYIIRQNNSTKKIMIQ